MPIGSTGTDQAVHFIATCTFGLESVVARELTELGYSAKASTTGRVEFTVAEGSSESPESGAGSPAHPPAPAWQVAAVRTNLWLRSADRVLICLTRLNVSGRGDAVAALRSVATPAPARDRGGAESDPEGDAAFDQLFEGVKAIPWERWIALGSAFPVAGRCVRSRLSSEPAVQRATKRAIVERLRAAHALGASAMIPEAGADAPGTVRIEVSILRDVATITIDTSGMGLHKRGYRQGTPGEAALKETMAAGLVQLSVWKALPVSEGSSSGPSEFPALIDPFCGSGTIPIEAAMFARRIAPGLHRTFDCEHWLAGGREIAPRTRLINPRLWDDERAAARKMIRPLQGPRLVASDIDPAAVELARVNARRAGVDRDIEFLVRDVRDIQSPHEHGCVVTNPPYGLRLSAEVSATASQHRPASRSTRVQPWQAQDKRPTPTPARRSTGRGEETDGPRAAMRPAFGSPPPWSAGDREIEALYRALPLAFRRLKTWSFHIFTGRLDLEALFGQQATRRRKMYNSKIECCYFQFLGPRRDHGSDSSHDIESDAAAPSLNSPHAEPSIEQEEAARSGNAAFDATQVSSGGLDDGPPETAELAAADPAAAIATDRTPTGPVFGGLRGRDQKEAGELEACLVNTLRHLRKYPARGITCFRVYDRDVPDVPLIIDKYEDSFHAAEYERRHSRTAAQQADWFELMRGVIARVGGVPVERVFMKEKHRQRGLTQHEKLSSASRTMLAQEGGLRFEVNLSDYIDTGLFLDHRLTRQMVREHAQKMAAQGMPVRFLNLFCYTGSFTVYAAAGGAASTTSVDLSNTYLDWAERNLAINRLGSACPHRFVRSDVLEFLEAHPVPRPHDGRGGQVGKDSDAPGNGGFYDLAAVDPPTFSNSKSTEEDWEVLHGHARVLGLLGPLMSSGGVVYFSTNFRRFKLDEEAVKRAGFTAREITHQTLPPEYRNRKLHKCWRLVKQARVE